METIGALAHKNIRLKELEEKRLSYMAQKETLENECQKVENKIEANQTKSNVIKGELADLFAHQDKAKHELKILLAILACSGIIALSTSSLFFVGVGVAFFLFKGIKPVGELKKCSNLEEGIKRNESEINRELSELMRQKEEFVSQINLVDLAICDIDVERDVIESIREVLLKYVDEDNLGYENTPVQELEQSLIRFNPKLLPKN